MGSKGSAVGGGEQVTDSQLSPYRPDDVPAAGIRMGVSGIHKGNV